ncbi:hypothetical protein AAC03nite_20460 [Alicyclobacillus acidoterrestris]|nr:hypothetical protein AAC03nite_20460 [Alicyclobacillus acidoterrestris]
MQETLSSPPSAREIAGEIMRYLVFLDVPEETKREAVRLIADEFEEGE